MILAAGATPAKPEESSRPSSTPKCRHPTMPSPGRSDIVAETISDHAGVRGASRAKGAASGGCCAARRLRTPTTPKASTRPITPSRAAWIGFSRYQVLAINRGEAEKMLRVAGRAGGARLAQRRRDPSSAPISDRRWPSRWNWQSPTRRNACCSRRLSAMCAAN